MTSAFICLALLVVDTEYMYSVMIELAYLS